MTANTVWTLCTGKGLLAIAAAAALVLGGCSAATTPGPAATSAPPPVTGDQPAPTAQTRAQSTQPPAVAVAATPTAASGDQTNNIACGPARATPQQTGGSSPETDWQLASGWFFTQAGDPPVPDKGFSVVNDDNAQLWSEFQRLGGWRALGFPASRRFKWHGVLSQATQRAILEWSPISGQVEFSNVLDLMHEDGRDEDLRVQKQIPPPTDVDEVGLPYETIAARRLAWLEARPAIKTKYCNAPGGADPIQLWGLPTSKATNMSEAGEVYVLRTQRAAFQEWVNGAPWAAPSEVTVVLAGDLAKEFKLLPAEAVLPEPAPPR